MNDWTPTISDIEKYQSEGYFVVRNFLADEEVERFRTLVNCEIEKHLKGRKPDDTGYEKVFVQIHNVWMHNNEFKALSLNSFSARIASILGGFSKVRVFLDQIICKYPGASETRPHQDAPYLSFDDKRSINCWIALDKAGEDNGGLEYFVGSNKFGLTRIVHLDQKDNLLEEYKELKNYKKKLIKAEAGDAIFHNCHTVHCASSNITTQSRRAYSIQYMPDGATFNGWSHSFIESYQPKVGDMLDYDCFPLVYSN